LIGHGLHDLGDAEVEHLDVRFVAARPEHEDVGRFDVTMRNAAPVNHVERHGDGLEDRDDPLHRPARRRAIMPSPLFLDQRFERGAFQPFEHHIRNPRAARGGEGADVARLHDARVARGELGQQGALLNEIR